MAFLSLAAPARAQDPASRTPKVVTGTERIGWSQVASSAEDLARYRFVTFVDGIAQGTSGAVCQTPSDGVVFECSANLPSMSEGTHAVQLAVALDGDGPSFESARSPALRLRVVSGAVPVAGPARETAVVATDDGVQLEVETLAAQLAAPSAVVSTLDGRLLVAEAPDRIRIWQGGRLLAEPALVLDDAVGLSLMGSIDLALHPDFARNGQVFLAYVARGEGGAFVHRVVRYRELANTLGEARLILEDRLADAPERTPRIRFGPDGKLYITFAAATRRVADDLASYQGKVLRLNEDGSTPPDNTAFSPIVSYGYRIPGAFDWHPITSQLWMCGRDWDGRDYLQNVLPARGPLARQQSMLSAGADLGSTVDPVAAAFYGRGAIERFANDLFVAAFGGEHLLRLRVDPQDPTRLLGAERLIDHQFGRITDVDVGADGSLYVTTNDVGPAGRLPGGRLLRLSAIAALPPSAR